MFFNQYEVENIARNCKYIDELDAFGDLLLDYLHIINSNSDGWAYWSKGHDAAEKFITALNSMSTHYRGQRVPVDIAALHKTLRPMKSLLTRRKLPSLDVSRLPAPPPKCCNAESNPSLNIAM